MNSIMISCVPDNGVIKVFLGSTFTGYIGLVDITLPRLDVKRSIINISCDQVDSTCLNRKRLLKSLYHDGSDGYQYHQFKNIMYQKLDSSDYNLSIRLYDDRGPIQLKSSEPVLMTLQLQPDTPQRWINM